jgi:hypothetical protein
MESASSFWRKLENRFSSPVSYQMRNPDEPEQLWEMNPMIGQKISLSFSGKIECVSCKRKIKKTFQDGYCFPCVQTQASCDLCIVRPELCHFHKGTCRDEDFAQTHCMQEHIVYLAVSSGLKIGLGRAKSIIHRWMDQGAVLAVPCIKVRSRYQAGIIERDFGVYYKDKTHWQKMLKNEGEVWSEDELLSERTRLQSYWSQIQGPFQQLFTAESPQFLQDAPMQFHYPVLEYPKKVTSLSFDKTPLIEGTLLGIKGQYLLLDSGVLNVRKFSGYHITLKSEKDA